MKKQIALVLAGTAASIAGGLRLIQDLVDRGDGGNASNGVRPDREQPATSAQAEPTGSGPARASSKSSKAELYEIATELGVSGRSKMSKPELIEAINNAG
jgi:hypothetical protein